MPLEMQYTPLSPALYDEAFRKHIIDRPGKLVFIGNHLTRSDSVRCLVRNISRKGADLEISPFLSVRDQFALVIQGANEEIGCALIRRQEERAYITFNNLLSPAYLLYIKRLGD